MEASGKLSVLGSLTLEISPFLNTRQEDGRSPDSGHSGEDRNLLLSPENVSRVFGRLSRGLGAIHNYSRLNAGS